MGRIALLFSALFIVPCALGAQQPTVPHDSVRGAIRAIDVRARSLEVITGVGYALRVVRLQISAAVPITDRKGGRPERIALVELRLGDVIRAQFGGQAAPFVAYAIERVGRMDTGVEPAP